MLIPHEVPPGPKVFVNRVPEYARLAEVLPARSASGVVICVFSGLPGVGKTALGRRCVERVRADGWFPDGDLHVDFGGGLDGTPVSVADALAACLAVLGTSKEVMPGSLDERANWLRSITAGKKLLILLDGVTEASQVLPFVPRTPGSAVLVLSSNRLSELAIDGAESIRVEPLADADAEQLMTELCGPRVAAEQAAFIELVARCAGLPVALRVAAARLVARPRLRVADLVAQIGDERAGLAPFLARGAEQVVAVFAVTYRALPESAARLYRLMGRFPARDLAEEILAVLAGSYAAQVAADVDTLIESGLVTEDAAGRFSLHPLVRRHAVHVADAAGEDDQHRASLRRVADFLLVRACFADRAVLGPLRYRATSHARVLAGHPDPFAGQGRSAALSWLDSERGTLIAVLRAAFAAGWHERVWQLAEAMTALYVDRRYLVDWTESSALGADAAQLAGDARAEARLRSFVSRPWTDLGELSRAAEELARALPLAEATGDTRLLASVWEMFGRLYDETDPGRAGAAYQRAITLFGREGDARGVAFSSYFLGCSQLRAGELVAAVATVAAAVAQIQDVGDQRMEGRALTTLGEALAAGPDVAGARRAFDSAIAVLGLAGSQFYEAVAQQERAELALRMGEVTVARAALSRAADLHAALGSPMAVELSRRLAELPGAPQS